MNNDLSEIQLAIQAAWQAKAYELAEELAYEHELHNACRCCTQRPFVLAGFENHPILRKFKWLKKLCEYCRRKEIIGLSRVYQTIGPLVHVPDDDSDGQK